MTILKVNWIIPEEKGTFDIDLEYDYEMSLEEWNALSKEQQEEELELMVSESDDICAFGKLESFEVVEQ